MHFYFLTQSDDFAKPLLGGHFGKFQDKLFFRAVFCIEQQQSFIGMVLACFYPFLIFDPK